MKAKIWLALEEIERTGRSQHAGKVTAHIAGARSHPFSAGENVLGETIAWAVAVHQRTRSPHSGESFRRARRHERRASANFCFVARKSGRPFAKTIELDDSMIAHEPKFLSENLIIFPKVGKGARYSFIFPRSDAALVEEIVQDLRVRVSSPIWPVDPQHAEAADDASEESHIERAVSSLTNGR